MTVTVFQNLTRREAVADTVVRARTGKERFYAPELDALRLVAFLLVFVRHVASSYGSARGARAEQLAGVAAPVVDRAGHAVVPAMTSGLSVVQSLFQSFDFGVCLFFFLSAFLITRLLLIEKSRTGTIAIRDFYVRRSLRIWPLYFFFLALIPALSLVFPILHVTLGRELASLFFVSNWAAVLHGWACQSVQPLWSVSVEEQFYLVWPVCARNGRKAIVAISAVCVLASVGTLVYLGVRGGAEVTSSWPNTLVQSIFFAGGALTAVYSRPEERDLGLFTRLGIAAAGAVCWVVASVGLHTVRTISPGPVEMVVGYLLMLAGTFLIFTSVAGWNARTIPAWMVQLGKMSYGLYVFHVACLLLTVHLGEQMMARMHFGGQSVLLAVGLSSLLGLILTVTCALLSYNLLELPFLKLKKRFTLIPSRPD